MNSSIVRLHLYLPPEKCNPNHSSTTGVDLRLGIVPATMNTQSVVGSVPVTPMSGVSFLPKRSPALSLIHSNMGCSGQRYCTVGHAFSDMLFCRLRRISDMQNFLSGLS